MSSQCIRVSSEISDLETYVESLPRPRRCCCHCCRHSRQKCGRFISALTLKGEQGAGISRRVLSDKDFEYIGDACAFIAIERNSKRVAPPDLELEHERAAQSASWRNWPPRARTRSSVQLSSALTDLRPTTTQWARNWTDAATTINLSKFMPRRPPKNNVGTAPPT